MKRPQDFPKTAMVCQTYATIVYLAIGIPVYCELSPLTSIALQQLLNSRLRTGYCGDYVASPALGSAGPLLKKICYGLSIPALVITAVMYVFRRVSAARRKVADSLRQLRPSLGQVHVRSHSSWISSPCRQVCTVSSTSPRPSLTPNLSAPSFTGPCGSEAQRSAVSSASSSLRVSRSSVA